MVDITLLALHLEDASFTANAPFTGSGEGTDVESDGLDSDTDASDGFDSKLITAVGVALVTGLAWLALRQRQGEGIEMDEEIEVLS